MIKYKVRTCLNGLSLARELRYAYCEGSNVMNLLAEVCREGRFRMLESVEFAASLMEFLAYVEELAGRTVAYM